MREVANGLMSILGTGHQWRAIPKDLPPRSAVHDYFELWEWDGTLGRQSSGAVTTRARKPRARSASACRAARPAAARHRPCGRHSGPRRWREALAFHRLAFIRFMLRKPYNPSRSSRIDSRSFPTTR
ncbi:MAG: transposase [Rhodospirillales bacterium]|nr:transposase [Rhodospirillales bacterium]